MLQYKKIFSVANGRIYSQQLKLSHLPLIANIFWFSQLKNKFHLLKAHAHQSHSALHGAMRQFQESLSYDEWLKYRKLVFEMSSKYRKLNKVSSQLSSQTQGGSNDDSMSDCFPLDGSITNEFYYERHTQKVFYSQQIQPHNIGSETPHYKNIESLSDLLFKCQQYAEQDSDFYLFEVLADTHQYSSVHSAVCRRYEAIQQLLCRFMFKGYREFSLGQQNIFFRTQTKYKGDFKFQISSETADQNIFLTFSRIARSLALMNQCRPKIQLCIELIIKNYLSELPTECLSNLLFCTAFNSKPIFSITKNIEQVEKKLLSSGESRHFFNLLLYLSISGSQSHQLFLMVNDLLSIKDLSSIQRIICLNLVQYLQTVKQIPEVDLHKVGFDSKVESEIKKVVSGDHHISEQASASNSYCSSQFTKYLSDHGYTFTTVSNDAQSRIPFLYSTVRVQETNFLCFPELLFRPENEDKSEFNVLGFLSKSINTASQSKMKTINGKMVAKLERWLQKDQYFKSKLKGIQKPKFKKYDRLDFQSPRQEFFQNKSSSKHN